MSVLCVNVCVSGDLHGVAVRSDLPVVHDHDVVAEVVGLLHVVSGQHHHTRLLHPVNGVPDHSTRNGIQPFNINQEIQEGGSELTSKQYCL